jgi:hypothetical protein
VEKAHETRFKLSETIAALTSQMFPLETNRTVCTTITFTATIIVASNTTAAAATSGIQRM